MYDNKGYFEIFDGLLAIILIFSVFLIFNLVLLIPDENVSTTFHNFKDSQDIMESLSSKINNSDVSFLEYISNILESNKNSKNAVKEISKLCKNKFDNIGLSKNYYFTETNNLNGVEIISNGNMEASNNITVASRNYGDYQYVLYVW